MAGERNATHKTVHFIVPHLGGCYPEKMLFRRLRFEPLESRRLLAGLVKYINPATGNDTNSGDVSAPWATLEKAEHFAAASPGAMSELDIDTSVAPLYVADDSVQFNGAAGQGLMIKSATNDLADVRFWHMVDGSEAVAYDTYYHTSGHSNVYVLVTGANSAIWEYMGGRGDNLKWLAQIKELGNSSTTYNDPANLTTLANNAWTFWTGFDGSNYVTLFNANGDPSGRQFAVSNHTTTNNALEIDYGTISKVCLGGQSGVNASGVLQPGDVIHAEQGAKVTDCILYAGSTHAALSGAGAAVTWTRDTFGQGPGWQGNGAYTTCVWFSQDAATNPPIFIDCNCPAVFGKRGSVTGCDFVGSNDLGFLNSLGNFVYSHNVGGNTARITIVGTTPTSSVLHGMISYASNITLAAVGCLTGDTTMRSGTLLNTIAFNNTNDNSTLDISDSVIYLNIAGVNGSHFPFVRGNVNLQSCTIIDQQFLTGWAFTRPIIDASQGILHLTVNDCILDLRSSDGAPVVIASNLNLSGDDTLVANRNIFVSPNAVYGLTIGNKTVLQMQALGYEAGSIADANNSQAKLLGQTGRVLTGSIALGKAVIRMNAADRTGQIFANRTGTGAYEVAAPSDAVYSIIGDYNHNGTVDSADYVVWRHAMGSVVQAFTSADGNGDGTVDSLDYDVCRSHFGQSIVIAAEQVAVAESVEEKSAVAAPSLDSSREAAILYWLRSRTSDNDDCVSPGQHKRHVWRMV